MKRPLEGVQILDLSRHLPGPLASRILADHGARVIRVDAMGGVGETVTNVALPLLLRKKESIKLNMRSPRGKELFLELAKRSDVLIESYRPGTAEAMGIGYDTLRKINPRLIYCSITGYGRESRMKDQIGHDINFMCSSGLVDLMTHPGKAPTVPAVQIADVFGGTVQAVMAILLALFSRSSSGEGKFLDISMFDGVKPLAHLPLEFLALGMPFGCGESIVGGSLACYGFYKTKDNRFVGIGALEKRHFKRLCEALGIEDLTPDQYNPTQQQKLISRLQGIFLKKSADEWQKELEPFNVCATKANTFLEAIEDTGAQTVTNTETAAGKDPGYPVCGVPFKLDSIAKGGIEPHTDPGRDTDKILKEIGLADNEIAGLRTSGVVG